MNKHLSLPLNRAYFPWSFWLVGIALVAGLLLAVLSWLELCVQHCAITQDYHLFGFPFAIVGIPFFSLMIVLHGLSRHYKFLALWVKILLAVAFGAEIMFIIVQKYQIGHWCPVCLGIATCITIAGIVCLIEHIKNVFLTSQLTKEGSMMNIVKHTFASLSFIFIGFLLAFVGISNPNSAEAVANSMKEKIGYGNKKSPIEMYYITDWFCPACKKIDSQMEEYLSKNDQNSTVFFVDYPIHKKSTNFVPYNLALMVENRNEKQYIKGRKALQELATKTESPTDEQVIEIAHKHGISFKELPYLEVKNGMEYFDGIIDRYQVNSTPTLVIVNTKTNQMIKLNGSDEINKGQIDKAMSKLTKSSK